MGPMSRAFHHLGLHRAAVVGVRRENSGDLVDHRLSGECIFARPAGDQTHLTQHADVPERPVRHDEIGRPMCPENRWLGINVSVIADQLQYLPVSPLSTPRTPGGECWPDLRSDDVSRVAILSADSLEDLVDQKNLPILRFPMLERPGEVVHHVAWRNRR